MLDEAMAWWYHAASFLYLTGLTLSMGAACGVVVLPIVRPWLLVVAPGLLLAGTAARLLAQTQMAFGEAGGIGATSLTTVVFETPWGWGWRWQAATAALLTAAGVMAWRRRQPAAPGAGRLFAGLALATAVAAALTGHAMAFPEQAWLTVPLHALHVAGAGAWMGTLVVLLLALSRISSDASPGQARRAACAECVHRFSAVALLAVAALALSGVLLAVVHIGTWPGLTGTSYGRALALKLAAFAVAGLCGAWNWRRVTPRLGIDDEAGVTLQRVGRVEVTAGLVVLLVTSLLAALPMPAELLLDGDE